MKITERVLDIISYISEVRDYENLSGDEFWALVKKIDAYGDEWYNFFE